MPHHDDSIIQVGPGSHCPACKEQRAHTDEEWKNHPFHRHGMTKEQGWSHPDLAAAQSCPDCIEAKKHAYSDATTAGFFFTECPKHRGHREPQEDPAGGIAL
jgi:hypothetical protein